MPSCPLTHRPLTHRPLIYRSLIYRPLTHRSLIYRSLTQRLLTWFTSPPAAEKAGQRAALRRLRGRQITSPWRVGRQSVHALALLGLFFMSPPSHAGEVADAGSAPQTAPVEFFEAQVRPLLVQYCQECHGPDKQESEFRVDARQAFLTGGSSGQPAISLERPAASLLLRAIRREGELAMPPDDPLPAKAIATLTKWIELRAPWSADVPSTPVRATMPERIARDQTSHWSFQPLVCPPLPQVSNRQWPRTGVDYFVLQQLDAASLAPSPAADRRTLIRRATFDLHGLPPTSAEVTAFVSDPAPDAYERLLERLLQSPRYGERWGRHWLDVARYADTQGYAFGRDRRYPYAYTYRDYVIRALNQDLPYDTFIVQQIAADQLDLQDDNSALAGLGFLTVGRKFNNRQDDIDDQIDVVTRGLMGLTVACARCHDHKYDAIPTEDYYSLYGIFSSSQEPGDLPLIGKSLEIEKYRGFLDELDRRKANLNKFATEKRDAFVDDARRRIGDYLAAVIQEQAQTGDGAMPGLSLDPQDVRPRLVKRWNDYLNRWAKPDHPVLMPWAVLTELPDDNFAAQAAAAIASWRELPIQRISPLVLQALELQPPQNKFEVARIYGQLLSDTYRRWKEQGANDEALRQMPDEQRQLGVLLFDPAAPTVIEPTEIRRYLSREDVGEYQKLANEVDAQQANSPEGLPRAMVLRDAGSPEDARVLIRGNPRRPGEPVPRRFPAVLSPGERPNFAHGSGRGELARLIVNPQNPLTARVIANRVWMHHLGSPLVDTPSDFGVRCPQPVQARLLDYLACRLQQNDWSLKALHREIMLSAVYQQQSVDRPDARQVDSENRLLWRMNRVRLEFEPLRDSILYVAGQLNAATGGKSVDLFQAPFTTRRSVYGYIDRQDLPNLLRAFDFASPDQSAEKRPLTIVPQQALFLLNSPFVMAQARELARLLNAERAAPEIYIAQLYERLLQRPPSELERSVLQEFLLAGSSSGTAPDGDLPNHPPADDAPPTTPTTTPTTTLTTKLTPAELVAQLMLLSNEFYLVD
jgi:hypothetical protein